MNYRLAVQDPVRPLTDQVWTDINTPHNGDHKLEPRYMAQNTLQDQQAAEVLQPMTMLVTQDLIEVQEQYGHVAKSRADFQRR